MTHPLGENELVTLRQTLGSALAADICDALGHRSQSLPARIVPHTQTGRTILGWARTVEARPVLTAPEKPYEREIDFIDSLGADEVVLATCSNSTVAFWGELFSAAAIARGAVGAVIDGAIRDVAKIDAQGFAVHCTMTAPMDSLGRLSIMATDAPVTFGEVTASSGDLVVADRDGVVIVPRAIAAEVAARALEKLAIETQAFAMLQSGALLREAWVRHGVL